MERLEIFQGFFSCNYGNALHEASSHSFGDTFEDISPKSESINNLAPLVARTWFRHLKPYANSTSSGDAFASNLNCGLIHDRNHGLADKPEAIRIQ